MLVWVLIGLFLFIIVTPQQDGFREGKKNIGKSIKKVANKTSSGVVTAANKTSSGVVTAAKTTSTAVVNTANKVGDNIAKIATVGLPPFVRNVMKHLKPIRRALTSFIKKD